MTSGPNPRLSTETLTKVVETPVSLTLTHRYRDAMVFGRNIGLFMAFLMCGLVCVVLTNEILNLGNGLFYLLSVSAWLLWFLFVYHLLKLLWGSQSLAVNKETFVYESRLFGWRNLSHFSRPEICSVACVYGWPNLTPIRDINHSFDHSIMIRLKKKRVRFGLSLAFDESKYLLEKLLEALRTDDANANTFLRSDARVLEYVAVSPQIAKNTVGYFLIEDDGKSLTLQRKEKFSADSLVGMLLINGIWNFFVVKMAEPLFGFGNLGGFAKFLNGAEWWFYLLLLILFAGFGLLLLYGLLKTIKNTFQKTSWTIRQNEIVRVDHWLVWSREQRYDLPSDVKLVPFENHKTGWLLKILGLNAMNPANRHFELTFQNQDGAIICSIPKLALDNVTALKKEIIRRRPHLFKLDPVVGEDLAERVR